MKYIIIICVCLIAGCYSTPQVVEGCRYESINGDELGFLTYPSGDKTVYNYLFYKKGDHRGVPIKDLQGKKAKLIEHNTKYSSYITLLTEDCVKIYVDTFGGGTKGFYKTSDLEAFRAKVNSYVYYNKADSKNKKLLTLDDKHSYELGNIEKLKVISVYLDTLKYVYCTSDFFILAEKEDGTRGYIGNDECYLENPIKLAWGNRVIKAIKKQSAFIGMTKEQVLLAAGKPKEINRTVGGYGEHEQWVYNGFYLYFDNGTMTSFQD